MLIWLVSSAVAITLHAQRILTLYTNAGQDSFHTLSTSGRIGLVLLSVLLVLLALVLVRAVDRSFPGSWKAIMPGSVSALLIRIGAALFLIWALMMVAPQIYYLYYLTLFPDLPAQWVIRPGRSFALLLEVFTLTGKPTYAAVFTGIVGWTLLIRIVVSHILQSTSRDQRPPVKATNHARSR